MPPSGQSWITPERLAARHANSFRQHEEGLIGIGSVPTFAIGQRAILVVTPSGNVLWDCISLIDDATIALIIGLGGLKAIAISHPHFYTTMVDWARAFDCPVHLHALDRKWVMRPDPALTFWEGDTHKLLPGVTLIRGGGHFPGGTMLHWAARRGWPRRAALGRYRDGDHRPQVLELHAQLSESDPALRARGRRHRGRGCAISVRYDLRSLLRSRDCDRRQGCDGEIGRALSRRDCRHRARPDGVGLTRNLFEVVPHAPLIPAKNM